MLPASDPSAQPSLAVSSCHTLPPHHHSMRRDRGKIRMPSQAARFLLLWLKDLDGKGPSMSVITLGCDVCWGDYESNLRVAEEKAICSASGNRYF